MRNKLKERKISEIIKQDYIKYKDKLKFYNHLCSIEIREAQVISHDSDLN